MECGDCKTTTYVVRVGMTDLISAPSDIWLLAAPRGRTLLCQYGCHVHEAPALQREACAGLCTRFRFYPYFVL